MSEEERTEADIIDSNNGKQKQNTVCQSQEPVGLLLYAYAMSEVSCVNC